MSSDESLMEATGKGNLDAFAEIVRRHQNWAWRVAYRFIGREEDAADIVQDAFLRLLDASGRYQPTSTFTTYLFQIITRLCLDRAKKKQPLYPEILPDLPDPRPGAAETMIRNETAATVRASLDALPLNQRMAIILRYYEEMSYEDIAAVLETTPKAVERLLARGRNCLRTLLGTPNDFFYSWSGGFPAAPRLTTKR
jgi:RNA polymerase sigma-70 factor, ECF subfamily